MRPASYGSDASLRLRRPTRLALALRKKFDQWCMDDPHVDVLTVWVTRPLTKPYVLERLDELVDELFLPGKLPLRPRHRWDGHDKVMQAQGQLANYKSIGYHTFQDAASSAGSTIVGGPDDDEGPGTWAPIPYSFQYRELTGNRGYIGITGISYVFRLFFL